ncbi:MAG: carbon-nitrogen hydrolase family protein [archaeon]|nr:carbon-nitrogen hydrolase family protein [archaeon]
MGKNLKISLIQCQIHTDTQKMNKNVSRLIQLSSENEPDLIILPERWRPLPDIFNEDINKFIQKERGEDYQLIKNLSKKYSVSIISGGIWENRSNGNKNDEKPYITSYYFNEGEEVGRQDKLHLYSFEPKVFQPGKVLNIFTHPENNTKFCVLICFDIAFYETPRLSVENGAELLISPTLINDNGLYNWKIYLQARALENRVPVAACNPIGDFFGRHFSGKCKIITFKTGHESPSTLKIKELEANREDILTERINFRFPNKIRKKRLKEKIDIENIIIKKY